MNAVGLFGGTFDPVHFGHLRAALEAKQLLGIDDFRLLPAGLPPHRDRPGASPEQRLEMLRLAVAGHGEFEIDDRELRRPGNSYMVDTLADIRAGSGGDTPLVLAIGQDAANALDNWHRWTTLFELAHIAVLRRPDSRAAYAGALREEMERRRTADPGELLSHPAGRVISLGITQLDISSSAIRRLLAAGDSPAYLMPRAVLDFVREQGLYDVKSAHHRQGKSI